MVKPLALIIQSSDVATTSISKLAESRDCSIHVSRSIEEAEQALAAFPSDQQKYVFVDLSAMPRCRLERIYRTAKTRARTHVR